MTGNFSALFEDNTLINSFTQETELQLLAYLKGDGTVNSQAMTILLPAIKLTSATPSDDSSGGRCGNTSSRRSNMRAQALALKRPPFRFAIPKPLKRLWQSNETRRSQTTLAPWPEWLQPGGDSGGVPTHPAHP